MVPLAAFDATKRRTPAVQQRLSEGAALNGILDYEVLLGKPAAVARGPHCSSSFH